MGVHNCQESPLEPGEYIIPTCYTTIEPPTFTELESSTWDGSSWVIETRPVEETPEELPPPELTIEQIQTLLESLQTQLTALSK